MHDDIRELADERIQAAVERALATIPEGKTGAVVAYRDGAYTRLVAAARLGAHWSVVGTLAHRWGKRLEGAAAVAFAW